MVCNHIFHKHIFAKIHYAMQLLMKEMDDYQLLKPEFHDALQYMQQDQ